MRLRSALTLTAATFALAACGPSPTTPAPAGSASPSSEPSMASSATPAPASSPTPTPMASVDTSNGSFYYASMNGGAEVPPLNVTGNGAVSAVLSADKSTLTVRVAVQGLTGQITMGHVHDGAAGIVGPVVKPMTFDGNAAVLTWKAGDAQNPLTPAYVADLAAGKLYVNVHTNANPTGELRGQLTPSGFCASGLLDAAQEVPPVTAAGGSGAVLGYLGADGNSLTVQVSASGLSGAITGAEVGDGAAGEAGTVVKALTVAGNQALVSWTSTDADKPLTPALVADFKAGKLFVNLKTAAHAGGELRGQLLAP